MYWTACFCLLSGKLRSWTFVPAQESSSLAARLICAQMSAHWWSCPIRSRPLWPMSRWACATARLMFRHLGALKVLTPSLFWLCRVLLWRSNWARRPTWSAQPSPRRKASTASSAPQRWPAWTSSKPSQRTAPPAVSPKDSSTYRARQTCSPPPSRRKRPRAARSCEWRTCGWQSAYYPKPLASLVLGKGGWARLYQGILLNPSLTPPETETPSVEVDTSLSTCSWTFWHTSIFFHYSLSCFLRTNISQKNCISAFKQYASTLVLHPSEFLLSRRQISISSMLEMCNMMWCKRLSDNSTDILF